MLLAFFVPSMATRALLLRRTHPIFMATESRSLSPPKKFRIFFSNRISHIKNTHFLILLVRTHCLCFLFRPPQTGTKRTAYSSSRTRQCGGWASMGRWQAIGMPLPLSHGPIRIMTVSSNKVRLFIIHPPVFMLFLLCSLVVSGHALYTGSQLNYTIRPSKITLVWLRLLLPGSIFARNRWASLLSVSDSLASDAVRHAHYGRAFIFHYNVVELIILFALSRVASERQGHKNKVSRRPLVSN